MILDKIIEGKHNEESFRFEKGFLLMFGRKWDKGDIQTLIETANLLTVEGYKLKKPSGTKKVVHDGLFGPREYDEKIYED